MRSAKLTIASPTASALSDEPGLPDGSNSVRRGHRVSGYPVEPTAVLVITNRKVLPDQGEEPTFFASPAQVTEPAKIVWPAKAAQAPTITWEGIS